jgi:hypothetical protein
MTPARDAARDESHTSRIQLLKAVEVAHEIEEAAPERHGSWHETRDSQRLVAHDQVLVQGRRKPRTSLRIVRLLEAVEVAHEIEDAGESRQIS